MGYWADGVKDLQACGSWNAWGGGGGMQRSWGLGRGLGRSDLSALDSLGKQSATASNFIHHFLFPRPSSHPTPIITRGGNGTARLLALVTLIHRDQSSSPVPQERRLNRPLFFLRHSFLPATLSEAPFFFAPQRKKNFPHVTASPTAVHSFDGLVALSALRL